MSQNPDSRGGLSSGVMEAGKTGLSLMEAVTSNMDDGVAKNPRMREILNELESIVAAPSGFRRSVAMFTPTDEATSRAEFKQWADTHVGKRIHEFDTQELLEHQAMVNVINSTTEYVDKISKVPNLCPKYVHGGHLRYS